MQNRFYFYTNLAHRNKTSFVFQSQVIPFFRQNDGITVLGSVFPPDFIRIIHLKTLTEKVLKNLSIHRNLIT